MKPLRRLLSIAALVLLAAGAALPASRCPSASGPELLLPEGSTFTVAVSSLDELQAAWARLAAALHLEESTDLQAMVAEHAPAMAEVLDPARTLAMSFRIHPVMLQREPDWTHVLPVRGAVTDPAALFDAEDVAGWLLRDGHLVLSSLPEPAAAAAPPAWWHDMLPGVIAAHADLAALIEENRGMVEMSLATMPMMAEQARLQAEAAGDDAPRVDMPSAEQMEGIASFARLLMDSMAGMDAALDVTADAAHLRTRYDVRPDSPLAVGPQPDFAAALDLTRRLPREADLVLAAAFDQGPSYAAMEDLYRASLRESYGQMGADPEVLDRWIDREMELMAQLGSPWAMSLARTGGSLELRWVLQSDDAPGTLALLLELTDLASGMGVMEIEARPDENLGSTAVHVRRVDFGLPAEVLAGADDAAELEHVLAMLEHFSGVVRLAQRDGLVLVTLNADADAVTAMLRGGGRPHDRIAALARAAGPDVRQVVAGDYGLVLELLAPLLESGTTDVAVPFTGTTTAAGTRGSFDMSLSLDGITALRDFLENAD